MATPTAASPRGVRRLLCAFFLFQAQASASGPSFVRLFYSPFFYSGGLGTMRPTRSYFCGALRLKAREKSRCRWPVPESPDRVKS